MLAYVFLLHWLGTTAEAQEKVISPVWNETGIPKIENYGPDEYGENPMNWGIVRDNRGVIYAANLNGILEFDGVSWRIIKTPKGGWVLSIAKDSAGTVYAGSFGDFGYLAPDSLGQMQFVSLLEYVEPGDRDFTEVWRIHCTKAGTFFRSGNKLFLWSNHKIKVLRSKSSLPLSSAVNDTLYFEERGAGLMMTAGDSLVLIPDSKRLDPIHFSAMLPYDRSRKLVCTTNGLLLFDGSVFSPFESPANAFLRENFLSSAAALPGGKFAIGTYRGGACIIDRMGRVLQILNQSSGLRNEDVKNLYCDPQGTLWMSLNSGIAQVRAHDPISFFTERRGLKGNVVSVVRHNGIIYAATSQAIFYLDSGNTNDGSIAVESQIHLPVFKPVKGIANQGFWLLSAGKWLLAATTADGVYQIDGDTAQRIDSDRESATVLCRSIRDTNMVYAGLKTGVEVLQLQNQKWVNTGHVKGVHEEPRTIVEDANGTVWLGTIFQGALKVNLTSHDAEGWNAEVERFGRAHGLPDGPINISKINGNVVFATNKGHHRFDKTKKYFYPDSTISVELADTTRSAAWVEEDRFGQIFVWPTNPDGKSELWMAKPGSDGRYSIDRNRFRALTNFGLFHTTYTDRDSVIWIGCSAGLVRYDPRIPQNVTMDYPALIRRVATVRTDSLIFAGFSSARLVRPVLPHISNALRFEYAAPFFQNISDNRYQYLLEGFDADWSNWTRETQKDYTNLPHGTYSFKVRARNTYGRLSPETGFSFEILAPWYLKWWAYAGYFALFVAGIYAAGRVLRARLIKREAEKAALREAEIFSQKNKELQDKNDQLQNVLSILQNAEDSLIDSESRFRSVAESANDAIITADRTGNIIFWNNRAQVIFGYRQEEAMGQPLTMLMPEQHREAHLKGLEQFYATGQGRIIGQVVEMHALKKDGTVFPIELTIAAWEAHDGKFVTGIVRDITRRKQEEEALQNTQAQLYQSEKMATLGKLSAGMAHELNNPAASTQRSAAQLRAAFFQLQRVNLQIGNLNFSDIQKDALASLDQITQERAERPVDFDALTRSDREHEMEEWLEAQGIASAWDLAPTLVSLGHDPNKMAALAEKFTAAQFSAVINWHSATYAIYCLLSQIDLGADRVAAIVKAFKTYTYMDQAPIQSVDVKEDLENTLIILRAKLKSGVIVRREYAKDLPRIEAYGSELNQVWTNIIDNAIDAMAGKGELILRTHKDDSCVVVEIADDGPGIPQEIQSKIFDPFFTTKPVGSGTGLGLNISHNIVVQKHRGQITVSSQPGKTCFTVRLPINLKAAG